MKRIMIPTAHLWGFFLKQVGLKNVSSLDIRNGEKGHIWRSAYEAFVITASGRGQFGGWNRGGGKRGGCRTDLNQTGRKALMARSLRWSRLGDASEGYFFGIDCLNQIRFDVNGDGIKIPARIGIINESGRPNYIFWSRRGRRTLLRHNIFGWGL